MTEAELAVKRERERAKRARLKVAGICTQCGKKPAGCGHALCDDCRTKKREMARAKYEADYEDGVCYKCGERPAREGKRTCFECAVRLSKQYYVRKEKGGMTYQ